MSGDCCCLVIYPINLQKFFFKLCISQLDTPTMMSQVSADLVSNHTKQLLILTA